MECGAVRVDCNLWRTFRLSCTVDWLTYEETPPLETRVFPSCDDAAIDACKQHAQKILSLSTITHRRIRVKVRGLQMPSPVVVAMLKFG